MFKKIAYRLIVLTLLLSFTTVAYAGETDPPDRTVGRELPENIEALRLDTPIVMDGFPINALDSSLVGAEGPSKVIIRLSADSGAIAFENGKDTLKAKNAAKAQQDAVINYVYTLDPNARVIARVQIVLNAIFIEVDASILPQLALDSRVVRIAPVGNYEIDLSETVPYIGASAVQAAGFDGSGIKVAVLDSGIDYLHAAFGGSGDPAEYAANDPTIIEPGTFPTDKVVGGYDFVGGDWPNTSLAPDPDPLDAGTGGGHGTHVAHIIGGIGGVAPGVDLYAVKVCSSVSTACSGIALIQGMDFAADPNGDGKLNDRVDIINMSLGSPYGQPFDDDLSAAVDNATKVGILTVTSSGNSSDKPYATGTPGAAPTALSVAQTQVPSAALQLITVNGVDYPAVFQDWSAPLVSTVGPAPVVWGGDYGSSLGCSVGGDVNDTAPGTEPYPAGSLSGMIVLVNRGDCNFSIKIYNIQRGGGVAGIIGLVDPSAPFAGSPGAGGPFTIPGYMISQAHANSIRTAITGGATGTIDPNNRLNLAGTMVGSSSRGPQNENTTLIKPEIGAPGASVSAIYGTGTGEGPFGGTSGAAPMVTGSAALLLQGFGGTKASAKGTPPGNAIGHGLSPVEVKALLMNNAETNIVNDPLTGALAPITRIGGGEVRVDQALSAPVAAWDNDVPSGSLSFGFVDVADDVVTITKTVRVRNYSNKKLTYTVTPTFRFADDVANGAVTVSAPSKVVVKPGLGKDTLFTVTLTINGALLRGNYMNSGSNGANPSVLTLNEYDGYLILDDGSHPIHLAWHVLPRKAAQVVPDTTEIVPGSFPQVIGLNNIGVGTAQNDAYALIAVSDNLPEGGFGAQSPTPDIRAVGINTFPVEAGYCSANASFIWAFAINTWERQQHLMPVRHYVILDTNQDGIDDYYVFNSDASGFGSLTDGRHLTYAYNLATGTSSAYFYTEHSTNTGNTVFYICAEQVGLTGTDMLATNVDMAVEASDWYYGGPGDFVGGLTVTPLGEQHFGLPNDIPGNTYDLAGLAVYDFGSWPGNTPELGLMLITNGDRSTGKRGGATFDTEALLFLVP